MLLDRSCSDQLVAPWLFTVLEQAGDVEVVTEPRRLEDAELYQMLAGSTIVLTGWNTPLLPEGLVEDPESQLRYVCNLTGTVRPYIPQAYVDSKRIVVSNWGNAVARYVAETALALILCCNKHLVHYYHWLGKRRRWRRHVVEGSSLSGSHVGLLGFGTVARELVALLKPFGPAISYYDPFAQSASTEGLLRVSTPEDLFSGSSIVSIHAALTRQTMGMVDAALLRRLPRGAILVNTARGAIVRENDLVREIELNELWVGLDVFETEPLPRRSRLRKNPRVTVTPHIADDGGQQRAEIVSRIAASNIARFAAGHSVEFEVSAANYAIMT